MRRGRRSTACCATTRRTGGDLSPVSLSPVLMKTCILLRPRAEISCDEKPVLQQGMLGAHSPRHVVGVVVRLTLS